MPSSHTAELRFIDPLLFLECVAPKIQGHVSKLLDSDGVHMLVIFSCGEENRYEYLDIGPGRRIRQLDEALSVHPNGHRAHFIVPAKSCPASVLSSGIVPAQSIPYGFDRLAPMSPPPAAKPSRIALINSAPAVKSSMPLNSEPVTDSVRGFFAPVCFNPMPDENPTDTLRRALHGVLSSITDREAALSVRESSTAERLEIYSAREREIEKASKELAEREAAVVLREASAAELEKSAISRDELAAARESAIAASEEDFKKRRNSVAFREKSLSTREQEMEARLFDVNAREGSLIALERSLAERDAAMAAREKELFTREEAFASERSRIEAETGVFSDQLKARETAVAAREKTLANQEATFRAETLALLQMLESITTASRASSAGK